MKIIDQNSVFNYLAADFPKKDLMIEIQTHGYTNLYTAKWSESRKCHKLKCADDYDKSLPLLTMRAQNNVTRTIYTVVSSST